MIKKICVENLSYRISTAKVKFPSIAYTINACKHAGTDKSEDIVYIKYKRHL